MAKKRRPRSPERVALSKWASAARRRDGRKCRACERPTGLHVHHVLPVSLFPELKLVVNNGITLCKFHHTELHRAQLELVLAPKIWKRYVQGGIEPHAMLVKTPEFRALMDLPWKALPAHELLRVVVKNPKKVITELHPKWAREVLGLGD